MQRAPPGPKSSNYLANLLALHAAKQKGAYEAIFVTPDGSVLEGASSNVFVVEGGALATPPASAGILEGVTRRFVLEAAGALGIPAAETRLSLSDVMSADEVFITSSLREVVPVVRVDDHEVGEGTPGMLTRRIHRAFRAATPARGLPLVWET